MSLYTIQSFVIQHTHENSFFNCTDTPISSIERGFFFKKKQKQDIFVQYQQILFLPAKFLYIY